MEKTQKPQKRKKLELKKSEPPSIEQKPPYAAQDHAPKKPEDTIRPLLAQAKDKVY